MGIGRAPRSEVKDRVYWPRLLEAQRTPAQTDRLQPPTRADGGLRLARCVQERCSSSAWPRLLEAQRTPTKLTSTSDARCTPQWLPRWVAPVESLPRGLSGALLLHGVTCCGGC